MSISQFTTERHKAYDEAKEVLIERHKNGESWRSLCKEFGFDKDGFVNYITAQGLYKKKSERKIHIAEDILQNAYQEYCDGDANITQLAEKYGVYRKTLSMDLKQRFGIQILQDGKKQVDDSYFDQINTKEKAYWLGFLYADGYNDEQASVELALQEIDKPHIEKFKTAIHSKHRLSYKTKTKAYRINIRSRQLCKALTKYGCSNHKSYTMDIPSGIPHMLISHFIRGYFDGDGCFYTTKKGNRQTGCITFTTASEKFADHFIKLLNDYNIYAKKYNVKIRQNWIINICHQTDVEKFYDLIYKDAFDEIWLTRKYQKLNSWMIQKYFAV